MRLPSSRSGSSSPASRFLLGRAHVADDPEEKTDEEDGDNSAILWSIAFQGARSAHSDCLTSMGLPRWRDGESSSEAPTSTERHRDEASRLRRVHLTSWDAPHPNGSTPQRGAGARTRRRDTRRSERIKSRGFVPVNGIDEWLCEAFPPPFQGQAPSPWRDEINAKWTTERISDCVACSVRAARAQRGTRVTTRE